MGKVILSVFVYSALWRRSLPCSRYIVRKSIFMCKCRGQSWRYLCLCSASGYSVRSCGVSVRVLWGTATDGSADRNRKNQPRTKAPHQLEWIKTKRCIHHALRMIRCSLTKTLCLHVSELQNPSVPCVFSSPVEHLSFIQAAAKNNVQSLFKINY